MKKLFLLFAIACSVTVFSQRTAKNYLIQLGGGNGSSWTKTPGANDSIVDLTVAGQTLTSWLTARTSWATGDQIWIAAGTYSFTLQYNIGSSPSLSTSFPSAIYGGFVGSENAISDRVKGANLWNYSNETILNGSGSTNGIFNAGGDRNMTIDGLTLTGCTATAGQAIYQRPNMTIQNCKFIANACVALRYYISAASKSANTLNCYFYNNTNTVSAGVEGGCIMANNGSSGGTYTVTGCVFDSNSCTATGSGASAGIKAQGVGNIDILRCIFKNNNATAGNSSAVSLTSTTSNLKNCLIYGTSVVTNKTALYVTAGNVINCTVVNNVSGAVYLNNTTVATAINLTNSVFWGTDSKSGQISAAAGCIGTVTNCAYNSLSTNFSGTTINSVDLTTTTTGLFTSPDNNLWTLAQGSVLIDMGTATGAPNLDLIGTSRPQQGGIDIGAYEYLLTAIHNPQAEIQVFKRSGDKLIAQANGLVAVYDAWGRLKSKKQVLIGDEINLPSGIFMVELTTPTNRTVQKVIL